MYDVGAQRRRVGQPGKRGAKSVEAVELAGAGARFLRPETGEGPVEAEG
jgi:hypothetical protein